MARLGARALLGCIVATFVGAATTSPVWAAFGATLSSTEGRPGDRIELVSVGNYDMLMSRRQPIYLISEADYAKLIASYGGNRCGVPEEHLLGTLSWDGGHASLVFTIPAKASGPYYFLIDVGSDVAIPSCWRVASSTGVLSLTVGDQPAAPLPSPAEARASHSTMSADPVRLAAVVLVAALILILALRVARHASARWTDNRSRG
jgi:hypothetical protein